jgi:hypothetical protein
MSQHTYANNRIQKRLFHRRGSYMTYNIVVRSLLILALVAFTGVSVVAQQDREVTNKQLDLKKEFNEAKEKQNIIHDAAIDKPRPSSGRRRGSQTTGYDYTQVKGYQLRALYTRMDQLFQNASDLELFDDTYHKDGTFNVAGRTGLANAQLTRIEVYFVEATPEEVEIYGVEPFDIIEIRVIKNEQLPPEDSGGDEEESGGFGGFGGSAGELITKSYTLAGTDLWAVIDITDMALYDDVLARRSQEQSIPLPAGSFEKVVRGPFVVMTPSQLETATSRFNDFWNHRDTMTVAMIPVLSDAAGPFSTTEVPLLFPEVTKIRVRNPNKEPLKISSAYFVGENASDFNITTKTPLQLAGRGSMDDKEDIAFEYVGESPYETKGELFIEAAEARLSQGVEVIANPGLFPADLVVFDFSLDQIELRSPALSSFAPDWKLSYRIGNPEANLPGWSSSTSTLGVGYKHEMFVGIVMPFNVYTGDLPDPLAYKRNLLSSPMGYNVTFDFTFGFPFSLAGNLTVLNKFDGDDAYEGLRVIKDYTPERENDPNYTNDFFHINTIAQVYYPIMFKDRKNSPNMAFRLDLGGGYMRIERAHLVQPFEIEKEGYTFRPEDEGKMFTLGKHKEYFDVYFRLSFINLRAKNNYGIGLQYFSGGMMADAWLELTDWFRVEVKSSFLLRDREVWEQDANYFMVTPRFRFGLPSIFN